MKSRSLFFFATLIVTNTVIAVSPAFAETQFLDPMYDVAGPATDAGYEDIKYGEGAINGFFPGVKDLLLDLYRPTGSNLPNQLPGLILIHGGSFTGGSKTEGTLVTMAEAFASRGYLVVSIDYRLAGDNPDGFAGNFDNLRFIAADDASQAISWMIENSGPGELCDGLIPDKITIGGTSAGAITALTLVVHDTPLQMPRAVLAFWGALRGFEEEEIVDSNVPPIFIMHGTADTTVPFSQTETLTERCELFGIDYELFAMAEESHFSVIPKLESAYVGRRNLLQHAIDFSYDKLGLEFLTGVTPNFATPTSAGINTIGDQVTFHFPTATGTDYDVMVSADLADWQTLSISGGATYGNIPSGGNGTLVVALPDLTQNAKSLFFVAEGTPSLTEASATAAPLSPASGQEMLNAEENRVQVSFESMAPPNMPEPHSTYGSDLAKEDEHFVELSITSVASISSTEWAVTLEGLTIGNSYYFEFSSDQLRFDPIAGSTFVATATSEIQVLSFDPPGKGYLQIGEGTPYSR